MKSPSDELAEQISALLVEQGLLLRADAEQYISKIAAGTMKAEDWLLAAEKAITEKENQ
jgi:hypothetical protein